MLPRVLPKEMGGEVLVVEEEQPEPVESKAALQALIADTVSEEDLQVVQKVEVEFESAEVRLLLLFY